jgi:lysophospholipase L1-like esterase
MGVWDPARTSQLNEILRRLAAKRGEEIELIDFNAKICPDDEFTNQLAGMSNIRPDGAHLSNEAADWTAEWLMDAIIPSDQTKK